MNEDLRSLQKDENINSQQKVGVENLRPNKVVRDENIRPQHAVVKFAELYGKRNAKFKTLSENDLNTISWETLKFIEPNYFFTKKDFTYKDVYEEGFSVSELFLNSACGIVSARDSLLVNLNKSEANRIVNDINELSENGFRSKYKLPKDSRDWTYTEAKKESLNTSVAKIEYRPFDIRFIPYSSKSKGMISYPRFEIMQHMIARENLSISITKQLSTFDFQHLFVTKYMTDKCTLSSQTKEAGYHFLLYTYSKDGTKTPNLNQEILEEIEKVVGKTEPEEILDYIYAVLHSPTYRNKYKEFLKIDFPRVPYPKDKNIFKDLVKFGTELRLIHLLESPKVSQFITTFPEMGSDIVEKPIFETVGDDNHRPNNIRVEDIRPQQNIGNVWINKEQYFGNVPETAWNFYIGGYQPAQKWLKDRKGRTLTNEEIEHYQKIIVALTETDRIMKEIDKIDLM